MGDQGIIIRGIGGFYDVQTTPNQIIRCTLRGKLRLDKKRVVVGDRVVISSTEGVIERLLPRHNELVRPAIANIDQVVVVMALAQPTPNLTLLDSILVLASNHQLDKIICFNKEDLTDEKQSIVDIYKTIGYTVLVTSTKEMHSIDTLRDRLAGKITTFAGPSGVGKSSLLNVIQPGLGLVVGTISEKLKRGKHTTRQVELIPLESGGLVADTPGFSQLGLEKISGSDVQMHFPEIWETAADCQYRGCMHHKEPNCAVKKALRHGTIVPSRYEHYLTLVAEACKQKHY